MTFGNILKKLRTEKSLSQTEVAKLLGIAQSTYANYETSNREPDFNTLVKLATFFDVSTDFLLGKTTVRSPIATVAAHMIDSEHEFSKEEEEEIRNFIEYVKSKAKAQKEKRSK